MDAMILQHGEDDHEHEHEHEHEQDHYSASAHEHKPTYYSGADYHDVPSEPMPMPTPTPFLNAIQKNTTTAQPNGAAGHMGALDSRNLASFLASAERAPMVAPT
jgi:ABC-type Zn2+ transport system substrate-binding protein/surface adhesin